MSQRRRIETRLQTLADIREIMAALRNTAVIESTRLRRLVPSQLAMLETIERAAGDFLCFHPDIAADFSTPPVCIAIGSERGFCGDYNEAMLDPLARALSADGAAIVVGRRLAPLAGKRFKLDAVIEGPSVADDIPGVVERLTAALSTRQSQGAPFLPLALSLLHHALEEGAHRIDQRRPFSALARTRTSASTPLRLQLPPRTLFGALVEHYLLAALNATLHTALLAENERRLQHLEGAIRRIDTRHDELLRRRNTLRQEEITEEIELILLSTGDSVAGDAAELAQAFPAVGG